VGEHGGRSPLEALTHRERQVLALMAEGRSNQAISQRLAMSKKTVESHVRSIFHKLGLLATATDDRRVLAVLSYFRGQPAPDRWQPNAGQDTAEPGHPTKNQGAH
jgi:DNA-binding CsgD family transcriptional regulator